MVDLLIEVAAAIIMVIIVLYCIYQTTIEKDDKTTYIDTKMSLTCKKCGTLAHPIRGTSNRYRCPSCGRQFANARHTYR